LIKEVIVVEGRDDMDAVKKAVDAEVICTSGFGITQKTIDRIKAAKERCGVIILTDPDFAGEKIREAISKKVPGCKHAFVPRGRATKEGDIGVENASPESIREALTKVKSEVNDVREEFSIGDMVKNNLTGTEMSVKMRDVLGRELGIGYGNSKQFLSRLNRYGITRDEFNEALERIHEVIK
jgi:ribonuclease M5